MSQSELFQLIAAVIVFLVGLIIKSPLAKHVPAAVVGFLSGLQSSELSKFLDVLGSTKGRQYLKSAILAYREEP